MSHSVRLTVRFSLPLLVWLFVYWSSLQDMVGVWSNSKTYEHSYLILPISLWLMWQKKEQIKNELIDIAVLPILLLVLPCLLWLVGRVAGIAFFEHIAAVTSLQLIIWALIGNQLARLLKFPLFYLVFCIPFGEELIPYLQEVTAYFSVAMVRLSGVPVFREGLYLTIPNGKFEVAEACSGIRFLISSIALGTLFANFFFVKKWKFGLYVIFACLFPILANGIRAYGIIMIGYFSDMKYATGADHLIYGWVFFAIVTIMMFYVAWYFQDHVDEPSVFDTTKKYSLETKKNRVSLSLSAIIFLLVGTNIWQKSVYNIVAIENQTIDPIAQLSSWGVVLPPADQVVIESSPDSSFKFFHVAYYTEKNRHELITSQNSLYDKETWTIDKVLTLDFNKDQASGLSLVDKDGNSKTIIYWYCINNYCSNNKLKIKLIKSYYIITNQNTSLSISAIYSNTMNFVELQSYFSNSILWDKRVLANDR